MDDGGRAFLRAEAAYLEPPEDCCEGDEFHTDACTLNDDIEDEYEDSDTARWKDQDRGLE